VYFSDDGLTGSMPGTLTSRPTGVRCN
jgi:hypothetical protein